MLWPLTPDDGRRLHKFFADAGYSEQGLPKALGAVELPSRRLRNLPRLLDTTYEPGLLNTLLRWFLIGRSIDERTASRFVPGWALNVCRESGLLVSDGDELIPTVLLMPAGGLLIASDPASRMESGTYPDLVLGINPTARELLRFTVRKPSRATLDLGTGCGIQALAAAAHSRRVVATDLNPHAIELTAFNAWLNGFDNVECLVGDAFAPVEGRTFDLIVCNPPFIIGPAHRFLYRDSSMELDQFCRRIVREAPPFLNEGGYFQMVCEWVQVEGQAWQERLEEWFEGTGCDAWGLKVYTQQPALYAQNRIRETDLDSPEADAANFSEWIAYYRRHRVQAIHGGLIAMRRRSGPNWVSIEELSERPQEDFGDSILEGFERRDFLAANTSEEQMLRAKPKLSPRARVQMQCQCLEGRWQTTSIQLELHAGLHYSGRVDPPMMDLLARCDGERTVEDLLGSLVPKPGVETAQLRADCLSLIRKLIEQGMVTI